MLEVMYISGLLSQVSISCLPLCIFQRILGMFRIILGEESLYSMDPVESKRFRLKQAYPTRVKGTSVHSHLSLQSQPSADSTQKGGSSLSLAKAQDL